MITDFKKLVNSCEDELTNREYAWHHHNKISCEWGRLSQWMTEHGYSDFKSECYKKTQGYRSCK